MSKRVCILLFWVLSFPSLYAQDLNQALQKLRKEYELTDRLHIVMQIQAFERPSVTEPYYQERADIRKSENNYLYHFGSNHLLMNGKYLIMVDKQSKEIVCNKRNVKAEAEFKDPIKVNLDSILTFYDQPQYLGREKAIDHYRVFQKKGAIGQIDLFIHSQTSVLHKIEYHYRDKQYVVVAFEVFDRHPTFPTGTFDESHYVGVVKGKIQAADAYKSYTLVESSAD